MGPSQLAAVTLVALLAPTPTVEDITLEGRFLDKGDTVTCGVEAGCVIMQREELGRMLRAVLAHVCKRSV